MIQIQVCAALRWRLVDLKKEVIFLREYVISCISRTTLLGFWLNCGELGELFISWVDFYNGRWFLDIEDKQAIDYLYAGIQYLLCVWDWFTTTNRLYRMAVDMFPIFDFSKSLFYQFDRAVLRRNVFTMYSRMRRRKWPYLRFHRRVIFLLYRRFVYCNYFNCFFKFLIFSLWVRVWLSDLVPVSGFFYRKRRVWLRGGNGRRPYQLLRGITGKVFKYLKRFMWPEGRRIRRKLFSRAGVVKKIVRKKIVRKRIVRKKIVRKHLGGNTIVYFYRGAWNRAFVRFRCLRFFLKKGCYFYRYRRSFFRRYVRRMRVLGLRLRSVNIARCRSDCKRRVWVKGYRGSRRFGHAVSLGKRVYFFFVGFLRYGLFGNAWLRVRFLRGGLMRNLTSQMELWVDREGLEFCSFNIKTRVRLVGIRKFFYLFKYRVNRFLFLGKYQCAQFRLFLYFNISAYVFADSLSVFGIARFFCYSLGNVQRLSSVLRK